MRGKRWVLIGGALAVVVIAALAVKYWIAPAVIGRRVEAAAERHWAGDVAIGRVRFRYFGPVRLEEVVFADVKGRRWIEADAVIVRRGDDARMNSRHRRIEADHVKINAHLKGGRLSTPLEDPDPERTIIRRPSAGLTNPEQGARPRRRLTSAGAEATDEPFAVATGLEDLVIHNLEVTAWDGERSVKVLGRAGVAVERRQDHYAVLVFEKSDAVWRELSVGGRVDAADGDCDLHVQAERVIEPEDGAFLIRLWNWPGEWRTGGLVEADATVSGPATRPAELAVNGTARLADWAVHSGRHAIVRDLGMRVRVQDGRYEVDDFACTAYGGRVEGTLWAVVDPAGPAGMAWGGDLRGKGISMEKLAVEMGAADRVTQGKASGRVEFAMKGGIEGLRGRAVLLFRETSLSMFPLSVKIIRGMGLEVDDPMQASNMGCAFDFAGTEGTIQEGRFANTVAAMETQPGGIVDVATGRVDLHVTAVPMQAVEDVGGDTSGGLRDAVLQMHVAGYYWDAPSALITKEPAGDVPEETLDFLRDAADGGRRDEPAFRGLRRVMKPAPRN